MALAVSSRTYSALGKATQSAASTTAAAAAKKAANDAARAQAAYQAQVAAAQAKARADAQAAAAQAKAQADYQAQVAAAQAKAQADADARARAQAQAQAAAQAQSQAAAQARAQARAQASPVTTPPTSAPAPSVPLGVDPAAYAAVQAAKASRGAGPPSAADVSAYAAQQAAQNDATEQSAAVDRANAANAPRTIPTLPGQGNFVPTPTTPTTPDWNAAVQEIIAKAQADPLTVGFAYGAFGSKYKTSGGYTLTDLPPEYRKQVDDYSNSREFDALRMAAVDAQAAKDQAETEAFLKDHPPPAGIGGGGDGPPGGSASFITNNTPNTQYKVLTPDILTDIAHGGTYNPADFSPADQQQVQDALDYAKSHSPGGGSQPGSADDSGIVDVFARLADTLNNGGAIDPALWAQLTPAQQAQLQKSPNFRLAEIPPGFHTNAVTITGQAPTGGGTGVTPSTGTPGIPASGIVPAGTGDAFYAIADAVNNGTPIDPAAFNALPPAVQAMLQKVPGFKLAQPGGQGGAPAPGTPAPGGQGPAGTPPTGTLDQQIQDMIGQLRIDATTQKQNLHQQYDNQRVQLARQFAIDPSGQDQGAAIRAFEELASNEANALAAVDAKVRDETRTNIATLLNVQQTQSQTSLAGRAQTLAETSTAAQQQLAREQAYGGTPAVSAQDLGVSINYKNPDGSINYDRYFQTIDAIDANFTQQVGRAPTPAEIQTLLAGGTIKSQQTLAAQQLALEQGKVVGAVGGQQTLAAQQLALEQGKAVGVVSGQQTLEAQSLAASKQQFDSTFLGQMTDANGQIIKDAQGNSLIGLDAQRLNQAKTEFDQNINLQKQQLALQVGSTWAQITGSTGTPAPISAQDLGVDLSQLPDPANMPPGAIMVTPEASAIRASFKAMTGKDATPEQVLSLLQGQSLDVPGAPTLEARKMASDITQATLNREADLKKTADSLGLGYAQLKQLTDATDKEWALKSSQVAHDQKMDEDKFKQAQMGLEHTIDLSERQFANQAGMAWAQITGTTGTPGPVDAKALGVDTSKVSGYPTPQALLSSPEAQQLRDRITAMVGTAPTDAQIQTLLRGGQIQVANTPTLEAQKAAAQIAQVAAAQGLDVQKFVEGSREFQRQFDLSKDQIAQQMGIQKSQADAALEQTNTQQAREKAYWDGLMQSSQQSVTLDWQGLASLGGQGGATRDQIVAAAKKHYSYNLTDAQTSDILAGKSVQIEAPNHSNPNGTNITLKTLDITPTDYNLQALTTDYTQNPNKYIKLVKDNYGIDVTPAELKKIVEGTPVTKQTLAQDWLRSFTPQERQEILALINGGQFSTAQQPGLMNAIGNFLGKAGIVALTHYLPP